MEINWFLNSLIWVFGCIGMTQIIVEGAIFVPVKDFLKKFMPSFFMKMMDCYQCCGFWCGVFMTGIYVLPNFENYYELAKIFVGGCASSFLSSFVSVLLVYLEANTLLRNGD